MSYSAKEIESIKSTYEGLVAEKLIGIELDAYGNPSAIYGKQVTGILVGAIKALENFPHREIVEDASREATAKHSYELFLAFSGVNARLPVLEAFGNTASLWINDLAFLEIPESLFTTKEIQAMLRQHPDFESMVQRDIDRGRLLADELGDSKDRVADMRSVA